MRQRLEMLRRESKVFNLLTINSDVLTILGQHPQPLFDPLQDIFPQFGR